MQPAVSKSTPGLPETLKRLKNLKGVVKERYHAKLVGVFGSYAREEAHAGSDIDILVHFEQGATLFDAVELEYFLLEELGIKPDIVSEKSLKPRIKPNILKDLIHI